MSSVVQRFSNRIKNGLQKATVIETLEFIAGLIVHGCIFSFFLTLSCVLAMLSGYWMVESSLSVFDFELCDEHELLVDLQCNSFRGSRREIGCWWN